MAKSLCIKLACRHLGPFLWVCSLHLLSLETTPARSSQPPGFWVG